MTEYIVDFTVQGKKSGNEYQATMDILADNQDMAEVIFYDGLEQFYPERDFSLLDVGTYEYNK